MTALELSRDYLFAGQGPVLVVYTRDGTRVLAETQVFESQVIHGIVLDNEPSVILAWGGSLVSFLRLETDLHKHKLVIGSQVECPDWILHAAFQHSSNSGGSKAAALVTAHNALLTLTLDSSNQYKPLLEEKTSQSKCILYTARVQWTDAETVLVAAGTVFGDVIVWSCNVSLQHSLASLHQVLTGHDGSIFGLDVFGTAQAPSRGSRHRFLASCSDDRTVRVWDISELQHTPENPQIATDLHSVRETGFGVALDEALNDQQGSSKCIAKVWGHASRIWRVSFVPSEDPSTVCHLVTFGEDATCHFWALKAPKIPAESYELHNLGILSLHAGKNIWSSTISTAADHAVKICTGGADGSIAMQHKSLPFADPRSSLQTLSIPDTMHMNTDTKVGSKADKLRSYAFLGTDSLIVATNSGRVSILALGANDNTKIRNRWQVVAQAAELSGYSVAASVPAMSVAFLSGQSGSIFVYEPKIGLQRLADGRGKTAALFAAEHARTSPPISRLSLLVTTVDRDTAQLLTFDMPLLRDSGTIDTQWLRLPPAFITTSFTTASILGEAEGCRMAILGSRNGALAIYTNKRQEIYTLLCEGAVGQDAVTDIAWVQDAHSASHGCAFITSRDGTIAAYQVDIGEEPGMHLVHQTKVPGATSLERLLLDSNGSLLVCGFRSKHFTVYDMSAEQEVMTIDCGGPNRTWTFSPNANLDGGTLAWTKASELCLQAQSGSPYKAIHSGGHGREIKAVAVSSSQSPLGQLIATGAEDTDIKISRYQIDESGRPRFNCLRTVKQHNTGIQHLQWSSDGRYLFSSGGFEELFVWRIRPTPIIEMGIVCESTCPTDSELPDLRIMSFYVAQRPTKAGSKTDEFLISTVRSDSTIRVYLYLSSATTKSWTCTHTGNYLSSCLTQTLELSLKSVNWLVTAGTDGHIAFLQQDHPDDIGVNEPSTSLEWRTRSQTHQNTIHCMASYRLDDHTQLLVTGGDDNALSVTRCDLVQSTYNTAKTSTLTIPRAHTAAITGLALIQIPGDNDKFWIVTGSIDQRLKLWEVQIDLSKPDVDGVTVKKLQNVFTAVADVSSLALLEIDGEPAVIICGVGMDVWRMWRPGRGEQST